jgi:putative membrane protein
MALAYPLEIAMTLFRLAFAFIVLAFVASHPDAQEKLSKDDMQTLSRMARADMAEIEAGKLAQQKASNPEVKKYGEHMVQEHTKMLQEGTQLAQKKGVQPPKDTDKKHKSAMKKLQGLSGEEFDRQYISQMVKDHDEVMKLAQKTAKDTKDPDLKAHVEKGSPHVKEHLDQARKIQASLGGSEGKSKSAGKSEKGK